MGVLLISTERGLADQIVDNPGGAFLNRFQRGVAFDFRGQRTFVGCVDAGETGEIPRARATIVTFGVTLLTDVDRGIHVNFGKGLATASNFVPRGAVGGDGSYQNDRSGLSQRLRNPSQTADIFVTTLLAEVEVAMGSAAQDFAVYDLSHVTKADQLPAHGVRQRTFPGTAKSSKPKDKPRVRAGRRMHGL
jgi:hypothetical protein